MKEIVDFLNRLNISNYASLTGHFFEDIIYILITIFGGTLLLFAWQHNRYFFAIIGLISGALLGFLCKTHLPYMQSIHTTVYIVCFCIAGVIIAFLSQRFVGMLLGGVVVLIFICALSPSTLLASRTDFVKFSLFFLLGGGLGAIFPRFFFIFVCSIIGASFVTFGLSGLLLEKIIPTSSIVPYKTITTLLLFLPALMFGMFYQLSRPAMQNHQTTQSSSACLPR
jgi:hypothetical protein